MTKNSRIAGKRGEDLACKYLKKDKYKVLDKNFSCKHGEIDIVGEDSDGVLCFIEVKARSREDYGSAIEAVSYSKQKKLLATAFIYIEQNNVGSRDMRFDIVSVDLNSGESTILKNAFEVSY